MLTKKQIKEIREHLDKAQNPIFFFDNDADGLCSFLLLQRWLGRGKGVAVRSYPEMDAAYFKKVNELNADYIFILDKPVVSEGFFEEANKFNVPVVWIDHHDVQGNIPESVNHYSVMLNEPKTNEPVTALCYQITKNKNDLWLAVAGCVADRYLPGFYSEFKKKYPELSVDADDAFDVLYGSEIGKVSQILNFGLKDSITNVVRMQKFLMKVKTPYDILEKNKENKSFYEKFEQIEAKCNRIVGEILESFSDKNEIIFFQYSSEMSLSGEIANYLSYKLPGKYIVVMRVKGGNVNISCRGENVRERVLKAIEKLEGATGGGHENAVGVRIKLEDLEKFKNSLEKN